MSGNLYHLVSGDHWARDDYKNIVSATTMTELARAQITLESRALANGKPAAYTPVQTFDSGASKDFPEWDRKQKVEFLLAKADILTSAITFEAARPRGQTSLFSDQEQVGWRNSLDTVGAEFKKLRSSASAGPFSSPLYIDGIKGQVFYVHVEPGLNEMTPTTLVGKDKTPPAVYLGSEKIVAALTDRTIYKAETATHEMPQAGQEKTKVAAFMASTADHTLVLGTKGAEGNSEVVEIVPRLIVLESGALVAVGPKGLATLKKHLDSLKPEALPTPVVPAANARGNVIAINGPSSAATPS